MRESKLANFSTLPPPFKVNALSLGRTAPPPLIVIPPLTSKEVALKSPEFTINVPFVVAVPTLRDFVVIFSDRLSILFLLILYAVLSKVRSTKFVLLSAISFLCFN